MHNGYVVAGARKMSKSLGNFITLKELRDEGSRGEAIRLALLSGHYRAPLDVTREKIAECKGQLDRLYGALRKVKYIAPAQASVPEGVLTALADDLNTPQAIAELHELASALNKADSEADKAAAKGAIAGGRRTAGPDRG